MQFGELGIRIPTANRLHPADVLFVHADEHVVPLVIRPRHLARRFARTVDAFSDEDLPCAAMNRIAELLGAGGSRLDMHAIGKPSRSVLIPLARQGLFLIPLAFVLSARFGLDGALFAVPIADTMAFLLSMALAAAEFRAWRGKDWLA